jgi:hypothetical protein
VYLRALLLEKISLSVVAKHSFAWFKIRQHSCNHAVPVSLSVTSLSAAELTAVFKGFGCILHGVVYCNRV